MVRANPSADITLRELRRSSGSGWRISGYAARFNCITSLAPGLQEQIREGAFTEALKTSDPRLLWNHNVDHLLGRVSAGTLRVWEDSKGLAFRADLPRNSVGAFVRDAIERGDAQGCSFGFRGYTNTWEPVDAFTALRTITKVDELHDCAICTYPAFEQTSVSVTGGGDVGEGFSRGYQPGWQRELDRMRRRVVRPSFGERVRL